MPARPALAVKVGNYSGDRPSAGLNQADVVFEEPVEGAITRLVAVFQCQAPALVGDVRSAREPDVGILSQLSDPMFAHAGGIDPVLSLLSHANLIDENILGGAAAATAIHPAGRYAPYSTFVKPARYGPSTRPTRRHPPRSSPIAQGCRKERCRVPAQVCTSRSPRRRM